MEQMLRSKGGTAQAASVASATLLFLCGQVFAVLLYIILCL